MISLLSRIRIWDINRSFIPEFVIDSHSDSLGGMTWIDKNTLWSCSKGQGVEGLFIQSDVRQSEQPIKNLRTHSSTWNIDGDIAYSSLDISSTPYSSTRANLSKILLEKRSISNTQTV